MVGDERITSALPDFRGRIWFVTKRDGKVGVLDPKTRRIEVVQTGEEIENSFTVDRDGIYIVSDKFMYRFSARRDLKPRVDWKVRYQNSGIVKPAQVNAGSGTTPTILPGGYVAITDNADPMNVVVYRAATLLARRERRTGLRGSSVRKRRQRNGELADRVGALADSGEQLRLSGPVRPDGGCHHAAGLHPR